MGTEGESFSKCFPSTNFFSAGADPTNKSPIRTGNRIPFTLNILDSFNLSPTNEELKYRRIDSLYHRRITSGLSPPS